MKQKKYHVRLTEAESTAVPARSAGSDWGGSGKNHSPVPREAASRV
jgi:hypothetical protein